MGLGYSFGEYRDWWEGFQSTTYSNLPGCLLSIRDTKLVVPIWIDAICVDLQNIQCARTHVWIMMALSDTTRLCLAQYKYASCQA